MDMVERSNAAYALHCEASALRAGGRNEDAVVKWGECVALIPDEPAYLREYADCCARLGRWEEGLKHASIAASLEPANAEAWALMAGACGNLGRQDEFIRLLDRADALAPNAPSVRWNRSLWLLLHGRYEEGWRDYEWRFMSNQRRRTLKEPWSGEPIPGRTLFVWTEQGFGDTIQFVRFLKRAKERSQARVVLEVQRELVTLLHGQDIGVDEVIAPNSGGAIALDDFEHVSLMSLPHALGINDEGEFWDGVYLEATAADKSQGFGPLTPNPGGTGPAPANPPTDCRKITPKVGVCWQGSTAHSADGVRSIDGQEFFDAIVKPRPEVMFVSINPDSRLPDCPNCINPELSSFAETAAVIRQLDLVVTVDTAVAHLAGALGVSTFLLVRYATDWRWCLNHPTSTPWYPSMRLFRQASYNAGWGEVLSAASSAMIDGFKA